MDHKPFIKHVVSIRIPFKNCFFTPSGEVGGVILKKQTVPLPGFFGGKYPQNITRGIEMNN